MNFDNKTPNFNKTPNSPSHQYKLRSDQWKSLSLCLKEYF